MWVCMCVCVGVRVGIDEAPVVSKVFASLIMAMISSYGNGMNASLKPRNNLVTHLQLNWHCWQ